MIDGLTDHVVCDHIDHEVHATFMQGGSKVLEIICCAIFWVETVAVKLLGSFNLRLNLCCCSHILLPISMIGLTVFGVFGQLGSHGGDPNGREAHSLNIIKLLQVVSWEAEIETGGLLTLLMIPRQVPPQYFY